MALLRSNRFGKSKIYLISSPNSGFHHPRIRPRQSTKVRARSSESRDTTVGDDPVVGLKVVSEAAVRIRGETPKPLGSGRNSAPVSNFRLLNARSFCPSAESTWKLEVVRDMVDEDATPVAFLGITETWWRCYMTEA